MNTYKNRLLYLLKAMLHIGVVLLIVFAQIKICGIVIKGNGLLIFTPFFLISLLGCIVQPMFCKNKTIKKYLFYILCVTNFIRSYILMYFTRDGLFPFTIIIFTIFLLYFLVNLSFVAAIWTLLALSFCTIFYILLPCEFYTILPSVDAFAVQRQ